MFVHKNDKMRIALIQTLPGLPYILQMQGLDKYQGKAASQLIQHLNVTELHALLTAAIEYGKGNDK